MFSFLFSRSLGVELLGHWEHHVSWFREFPDCFPSGCTFALPPAVYEGSDSAHLGWHLLSPGFTILAVLEGVKR